MEGQCTKVMKVTGRQTTSTTMTGGPAWAQTGLYLQISTHPRSQKEIQTQSNSLQQAVVSSPNLEHLDSTCVDDIHQKTSFKPFLVKSRLGWLEDKYVWISIFSFSHFSQEFALDLCPL